MTFALTVFADLTVAVQAGMILAALLFISRVAATTTVSQVTDDYVEDGRVHILQDKDIPYYAPSSASTARSCSAPPTRSRSHRKPQNFRRS